VNTSHCIGEFTPPFVCINGTHKVYSISTSQLNKPPEIHEDALATPPRPQVLRPSSTLRTSSDHIHSGPFHESPAPAALQSVRSTPPLGQLILYVSPCVIFLCSLSRPFVLHMLMACPNSKTLSPGDTSSV
jgi:hypothetical protein